MKKQRGVEVAFWVALVTGIAALSFGIIRGNPWTLVLYVPLFAVDCFLCYYQGKRSVYLEMGEIVNESNEKAVDELMSHMLSVSLGGVPEHVGGRMLDEDEAKKLMEGGPKCIWQFGNGHRGEVEAWQIPPLKDEGGDEEMDRWGIGMFLCEGHAKEIGMVEGNKWGFVKMSREEGERAWGEAEES